MTHRKKNFPGMREKRSQIYQRSLSFCLRQARGSPQGPRPGSPTPGRAAGAWVLQWCHLLEKTLKSRGWPGFRQLTERARDCPCWHRRHGTRCAENRPGRARWVPGSAGHKPAQVQVLGLVVRDRGGTRKMLAEADSSGVQNGFTRLKLYCNS